MDSISKLASESFEVIIPQIVLCEALATLIRDYQDPNDAHAKIRRLYEEIRKICTSDCGLPTITVRMLEEARTLMSHDEHLSNTDATITAQALLDPNLQRLLTTDRKLLGSKVIIDEEMRLKKSGGRTIRFKIVDGLWRNHSLRL